MHAFGDRGRRTLHSLSFQGRLRNAMEMTGAALRAICKENKLYETPELNETLYCNHRGFISVAELEPYSGLRALFLDNNALDTLDGVPALPELRCLCASPCIASERQAVACFANPATRRVCLTECYPAPQVRAVQHVDGRSRPQPAGQPGHAQRQQQQRVHPRCARARSLTSASGATNRATPRSLAAWVLLRVDNRKASRLAASSCTWNTVRKSPVRMFICGQGLAGCTRLRTLLAAGNRLTRAADVARLAECAALVTLDLQENQLADPQVLWRSLRPLLPTPRAACVAPVPQA